MTRAVYRVMGRRNQPLRAQDISRDKAKPDVGEAVKASFDNLEDSYIDDGEAWLWAVGEIAADLKKSCSDCRC